MRRGLPFRTRWLTLGLALLWLLSTSLTLFVVGRERPLFEATFFGGPLDPSDTLHLRLNLKKHPPRGAPALPAALTFRVVLPQAGDAPALSWHGSTDEAGHAALSLPTGNIRSGTPRLRLELAEAQFGFPEGYILAEGELRFNQSIWESSLQPLPLWSAPGEGDLSVRVAPAHGALALPFRDAIWLSVEQNGARVAGVNIELDLKGASWLVDDAEGSRKRRLVTNEEGLATAPLVPDAQALQLEIEAALEQPHKQPLKGRLSAELPVYARALALQHAPDGWWVASSGEEAVAYTAIVNERGRVGGGRVDLHLLEDGTRAGHLGWPIDEISPEKISSPPEPHWALLSPDPNFPKDKTLGWPLHTAEDGPHPALRAAEIALLSGLELVSKHERARVRRAYLLDAALSLVCLLQAYVLHRLGSHQAPEGWATQSSSESARQENAKSAASPPGRAPRRSLLALFWGLNIALGSLLLALASLYRSG